MDGREEAEGVRSGERSAEVLGGGTWHPGNKEWPGILTPHLGFGAVASGYHLETVSSLWPGSLVQERGGVGLPVSLGAPGKWT